MLLLPFIFCVWIILSGCATTGPEIPQEELKTVEKELEDLSSRRYVEDQVRIWKVEYKILKALPPGEVGKEKIEIGALVESSEKISRALGLPEEEKCIVIGVIDGGPADLAGIKPRDLILNIEGKEVESPGDIEFTEGKPNKVVVQREGKKMTVAVVPEKVSHIEIHLKETDKVNAFAKFTGIDVTRGMLRFVENDDELAVIIGHEIAHISHQHIPKDMAVPGLCGMVGGLTGPFAGPVTQALYAPYCRGNEREADYFGLLYAHKAGYNIEKGIELWKRFAIELPKSRSTSFLRTHPATPERILRVKKVMEMIKEGHGEWGSTTKEEEEN